MQRLRRPLERSNSTRGKRSLESDGGPGGGDEPERKRPALASLRMRLNSVRHLTAEYRVVKSAFITSASRSRWDDLNHDVLVDMMKRVPWRDRLYVACLVSKSWLSAILDSLSPSGVINLKIMDHPNFKKRNITQRYLSLLKRMLDSKPLDSCSALFIGETLLKSNKYVYIAKRTPSLQQLVIPEELGKTYSCFTLAMFHWRKLKKVQCPALLFRYCIVCFREVESLRLVGVVDDRTAMGIRDSCPELKRLCLMSSALSINALSTILDGHNKLEVLDTRHCFRVRDCPKTAASGASKAVEWNEEEIQQKAANVKVHLRCSQQRCPECSATRKRCFPKAKTLANNRYWEYL